MKKRSKSLKRMVHPARFERTTFAFGGHGQASQPEFADAVKNAVPGESIEIPKGFSVTPALIEDGETTAEAWFLTRKPRKTCQKSVNGRARRRSA